MTMFKDLDELEVIEKVSELADEFEVVKEPGGYIAYVDGGWLPNVYNSEDEACREILAYVVGERKSFFNSDVKYCIRNTEDRAARLYWVDGHGWEKENYSVFSCEEKYVYSLPDDGEWEEC